MSKSGLWERKRQCRSAKCWLSLSSALTHGLERLVLDLRIYHIPNCGHWVQNEAAAEVSEQVKAFLQEVVGDRETEERANQRHRFRGICAFDRSVVY
jgi:hypothetical protein